MTNYILFYSNYCKHSYKLINALEQTGQAIYFNKISVDKNRQGKRPEIMYKYNINVVPTLIVDNKLLAGETAFKWLVSRIEDQPQNFNPGKPCSVPMSGVPRPGQSMASRSNKQGHIQRENNEVDAFVMSGDPNNITDNCLQIGDISSINLLDETGEIIPMDQRRSNFKVPESTISNGLDLTEFQKDSRLKVTGKNDKLKTSQLDNEYNKLMQERELSTPKSISRC